MVTRKMRVLAASLALVLCVSLYSVPKAKAVATEIAVGTAAVASYFQATGLTMAASAGATGALVTTGVADIAGSYALATGAATSGTSFLSSLVAGVSISPAGAIVLTAAAVVAIGALVAWYVGENGLEEEGSSVPVHAKSGFYDIHGNFYPVVYFSGTDSPTSSEYESLISSEHLYHFSQGSYGLFTFSTNSAGRPVASFNGEQVLIAASSTVVSFAMFYCPNVSSEKIRVPGYISTDVSDDFPLGLKYKGVGSFTLSELSELGLIDSFSSVSLDVTRAPEFTQPDVELDAESQKQMVIDAGFAAGTTLDTVATEVPELIAAGTMAPTYEITTTETDTGTDSEPEEELAVVPWLERIHTTLTNLGTSIADKIMTGLQSLFVPDEAFFAEAVPELQETFQGRMGLLTFPISLLADFLGRLLDFADQEPILRWNSVSIYGTELIAAGQYNLNDALKSAPVKQMHDIYMIAVNAILIFAFLGLCHNKYRKIMQN